MDDEENTQYSAKYGIVTFSLGVLQSDIVEFMPGLPPWKRDAILAVDMADYIPILVKWPYRFWNTTFIDNEPTEFILFNEDRFGFFTWVYNLDHPNLWNESLIWRFDVTMDLAQMVQYQSLNDTIKMIIDLKLSHYFDDIPFPEDIFVADWKTNKYVQGSYSFGQVGFYYDECKSKIRWPLKKSLFFAGEVLNDFDYGFVHTAWLSGQYTANTILSCMGMDGNGIECPDEYVPSSPVSNDCPKSETSTAEKLIPLWIIIGILCGAIIGYFVGRYATKMKGNVDEANLIAMQQNQKYNE